MPTGGQVHRAIQGEGFDAEQYDNERAERTPAPTKVTANSAPGSRLQAAIDQPRRVGISRQIASPRPAPGHAGACRARRNGGRQCEPVKRLGGLTPSRIPARELRWRCWGRWRPDQVAGVPASPRHQPAWAVPGMWMSLGWLVSQTDAATPSTPPTARPAEGGATRSSRCVAGLSSCAGDLDHERGSTWDTSFQRAESENSSPLAGAITSSIVRARAERHPIRDDAGVAPAVPASRT